MFMRHQVVKCIHKLSDCRFLNGTLFITGNMTIIDTKSVKVLTCTGVFCHSIDREWFGSSSRSVELQIKYTIKYVIYFTVQQFG
jgi:hypothetical protein